MERTWNCGIGMAAIVAPEAADLTIRSLAARGMKAWAAGVIQTELVTAQRASKGRICVGSHLRDAITFGSEELITYKARRRSRAWGEADKKQKPHE